MSGWSLGWFRFGPKDAEMSSIVARFGRPATLTQKKLHFGRIRCWRRDLPRCTLH